jgi:OmpA-OmpF porin, OOP family
LSNTLKHLFVVGASVAILAGCASSGEKPAEQPAAAPVKPVEEAKPAPAPVAPAVVEAPKAQAAAPVAPPPPPKITSLKANGLFDFNKSVLRPDATSELDKGVVSRKSEVKQVNAVTINGHADRIGSQDYNQKLSEKRAEAVKAYLVGKGVPANNIETNGYGKTQPAQGVAKCDDALPRKKLIDCLQPHRRVEVELKGEAS